VKIEDGCEAKCSYCAISPARGPVRSKRREEVISEVEALYKSGVREIVLTGIETGSYGRDFDTGYGLADLIVELDARESAERIRLGSLAPELVGGEFARKVSGAKILAPHFHLSMQSGSDRILAKMRRRYTAEMAYRNIEAIREAIPGAEFTTDLMVGFPGETEEDFLATVEFVRKVGFIACHVFTYSRREGTPAATYEGQIPEREKKERTRRLISVAKEVRDAALAERVKDGGELSVILETYRDGVYTGHSDEFYEVSVPADAGMEGEYVRVKPISSSDGVIYAEML
jgi:threonylcarbamoyladenosine tRNA methylthiotransferase MtaB